MHARGKIELVDIPEPRLDEPSSEPGQILFEPHLACLCGSDLPYFDSDHATYPQPVGYSLHEMIGTVVGTTGQRFRTGDRVLAVPIRQRGLYERYAVSEARAIPLDTRRPPEQALLAQPLGTVIFGLRKLPTVLDKDVAIVGQGPIGQLFCAALRNLGAREIIAIDRLASRLAPSEKMGATAAVDASREDAIEAVKRITGGHGADVVVEAVGHDDHAIGLCIDLCAKYGRILSFGVPPEQIDGLRWRELFYKNITVHTSVDPDFTRDFPLAMRWIGEGRVDLSSLITHRYRLSEIQTAFETFRDRKDGAQKVLVEFPRAG
ncbi:MAG: zinc-binding dehydrogenase [Planctomycetia bacterium]|nr:zinc-binding dehydrogenase [Planctomycetia bacterium]